MNSRILYNFLLLTLILCLWMPVLVSCGKVREEPGGPLPAPAHVTTRPKPVVQPLDDNRIISESNRMGNSTVAGSPAREDVSAERVSPITQDIGLKIIGTVVADNPEMSAALIENRATQELGIYREGDRVGNALIKKILSQHVIIDAGKGDEMLTMLYEQPSGRQPALYQAAGAQSPATTVRSTRLDHEEVEPYLADINRLKGQLQIYPIKEENEPTGFLIRNIRRGSILWKMGLRNRDVIKGINGEAIRSPDDADAFFQTLKNGGDIVVEIERRRHTQELRFAIQ